MGSGVSLFSALGCYPLLADLMCLLPIRCKIPSSLSSANPFRIRILTSGSDRPSPFLQFTPSHIPKS